MNLDKKLVAYVANLSRLSFKEEEVDRTLQQINEILHMMEMLNEVDTSAVPETAHVQDLKNVMRPDLSAPSCPRDEILSNAPQAKDGAFAVPRVIP